MSAPSNTSPSPASTAQPDQLHSGPIPATSQAEATRITTESANTAASPDLSDTGQRWPLRPYRLKKARQRSKRFPPSSRYILETEDDESDQDGDAASPKPETTRSITSEDNHLSTLPPTPAHSTRDWRQRSPAQPSGGHVPGTCSHTIDLSTLATIVYQKKTYIRVGWAEGHRINKEYWAYARVGHDGAVHQVFGCGIVFDDRPMFYESKFARKDIEAWTRELSVAVARVEARQTERAMPREDAYARLTTTRTNGGLTVTWQPDVSAVEAPSTAIFQSTTFAQPTEPDETVADAPAPTETYQDTTIVAPTESNEPINRPSALTVEHSTSSNVSNKVYGAEQLLALAQASGSSSGVLSDDL